MEAGGQKVTFNHGQLEIDGLTVEWSNHLTKLDKKIKVRQFAQVRVKRSTPDLLLALTLTSAILRYTAYQLRM